MTSGLKNWLQHLSSKKIPVFKQKREQLLNMLQDEQEFSLADCQPVLLADPLMCANLFSAMNKQRVKNNRLPVTTLSSLLSLFGTSRLIDEIKSMLTIEELKLPDVNLRGIQLCLKQSWYAGWFANQWAIERDVREPEEVYIAAVMQSIPELLLWCYGDEVMPQINHHAYCECKVYHEVVEEKLGCHKRQIGRELALQWELPELVSFAFETKFNAYTNATSIGLAALLSRICQHGWYGKDLEFFYEKATHYFGEDRAKTSRHIHHQLLMLVNDEVEMGYLPVASKLISIDDKQYPERSYCLKSEKQEKISVEQQASKKAAVENTELPSAASIGVQSIDQVAFENAINELKLLVKKQAGFNDLLRHAVLSLHKVLGFKRVSFFVCDGSKNKLINKLDLNASEDSSLKGVSIILGQKNIFRQLMGKPQSFFLHADNKDKYWSLIPGELKSAVHSESFCVTSVCSKGKCIGMIYTDNNGEQISLEYYKAYQKLTMMFNKALEIVQKNKS